MAEMQDTNSKKLLTSSNEISTQHNEISPLQFDFWTKDNVMLTQHNAD
jgi:hypothetical protein